MAGKMTLREAAIRVLTERGPLHYREFTKAVLDAGLAGSSSTTPDASLSALIAVDIERRGKKSPFVCIKPGVFGGAALHRRDVIASMDEEFAPQIEVKGAADQRVRVPLFPGYSGLHHRPCVSPGRPRRQATGLRSRDKLIEHDIGARKRVVEVLELSPEALAASPEKEEA